MSEEDHDRLLRIEMQVGRIVSDAESEKDTRRRRNQSIETRFEQVESRLRALEEWKWKAIGVTSVLGGLGATMIDFLVKK